MARGAVTAALVALCLGGCADGVSQRDRSLSASEARTATAAGFGIPIFRQQGRTEATIANVDAVYYGGTGFENVVLSVFNDEQGKEDLLGEPSAQPPQGTTIISVANVVVLYSRDRSAPDRSDRIRRALEAAAGA